MIKFTVWGEPKGKGRQRYFRRGTFVGNYTPEKTRIAERSILAQALDSRPSAPLKGPVKIDIKFFMPIPKSVRKRLRPLMESETFPHTKKPDIDNLVKSVLDPLNTVFWEDDRQIYCVSTSKCYGKIPRTEVIIEETCLCG